VAFDQGVDDDGKGSVKIHVKIDDAIKHAQFRVGDDPPPIITDIYWPHDELYREGKDDDDQPASSEGAANGDGDDGAAEAS